MCSLIPIPPKSRTETVVLNWHILERSLKSLAIKHPRFSNYSGREIIRQMIPPVVINVVHILL